MKTKLDIYTVLATVTIKCGVQVLANSLREAVTIAGKMDETDFVTVLGEYVDGECDVIGVYKCSKP
jgi:predicted TIM-barrel enzyme